MESPGDKDWAAKYLLDPLNAPEPSDETGPGTHFGNSTHMKRETSPDATAKKGVRTSVKSIPGINFPAPPHSSSPRTSTLSTHRQEAFGDLGDAAPQRAKSQNTGSHPEAASTARRRGSSLGERYPGDMSHRPLEVITRDSLRANRSRHLRKAQHSGSDSIDRLDDSMFGSYHHEGPYDAASMAKNRDPKSAPLAALSMSNREALRATPNEMVADSIKHHRPLDGTAFVPPGFAGPDGRVMNYKEGTDMMRFNGNELKRWPGMQYHPDDLKGKGEPSYSVEKALKDHKLGAGHRRNVSDGAFEMKTRGKRSSSLDVAGSGSEATYSQWAESTGRSGSKSKDFVKRLGSFRRRHGRAEDEPLTPTIKTRYG